MSEELRSTHCTIFQQNNYEHADFFLAWFIPVSKIKTSMFTWSQWPCLYFEIAVWTVQTSQQHPNLMTV